MLPTDNEVRLLAVGICAMPNPPSWNDCLRIAQWLMVQRIVSVDPTPERDSKEVVMAGSVTLLCRECASSGTVTIFRQPHECGAPSRCECNSRHIEIIPDETPRKQINVGTPEQPEYVDGEESL